MSCAEMRLRAAPTLLAHVNLMLTLYGGAALASAARLKWDPSTYLVLRELFPVEYRVVAAAATAGGFTLLLLPHVAAAALHASRPRNRAVLLYVYAAVLTVLMVGELAVGGWLLARGLAWWRSAAAQSLVRALQIGEELRSWLPFLSRLRLLGRQPQHLNELIQEAKEDAPRNVYVALVLVALLALLQLAAAVAALVAARAHPARARAPARALAEVKLQPTPPSKDSSSSYQKMPHTKMLRKAPERPHRHPGAAAQVTSPPPPAHPGTWRDRLPTLWGLT